MISRIIFHIRRNGFLNLCIKFWYYKLIFLYLICSCCGCCCCHLYWNICGHFHCTLTVYWRTSNLIGHDISLNSRIVFSLLYSPNMRIIIYIWTHSSNWVNKIIIRLNDWSDTHLLYIILSWVYWIWTDSRCSSDVFSRGPNRSIISRCFIIIEGWIFWLIGQFIWKNCLQRRWTKCWIS